MKNSKTLLILVSAIFVAGLLFSVSDAYAGSDSWERESSTIGLEVPREVAVKAIKAKKERFLDYQKSEYNKGLELQDDITESKQDGRIDIKEITNAAADYDPLFDDVEGTDVAKTDGDDAGGLMEVLTITDTMGGMAGSGLGQLDTSYDQTIEDIPDEDIKFEEQRRITEVRERIPEPATVTDDGETVAVVDDPDDPEDPEDPPDDPDDPPDNGGCFLAGTPILMADGSLMSIEDVGVGDILMAFDEETGELKEDKVSKFFKHEANEYLIINGHLRLTKNHPVYSNGEWVEIGKLKIGDNLISAMGKPEAITSIEEIAEDVSVYNLEVNPYNTYIAGGIVVHNKKAPRDPVL